MPGKESARDLDDRELFKKGWKLFVETLDDLMKTHKELRQKIQEKQRIMRYGARRTSGLNL